MGSTQTYNGNPTNQTKIHALNDKIAGAIHDRIQDSTTGKVTVTAEINMNQGGIGEMYIEVTDRNRL